MVGSSTFVVPNGMVIAGGTFAANIPTDGLQTVIQGDMIVDGGTILMVGTEIHWGSLEVRGNVDWVSGTYKPIINLSTPGQKAYWRSTKTFTVGSGVVIDPDLRGIGGMANDLWTILAGDVRVAGAPPLLPIALNGRVDHTNPPYPPVAPRPRAIPERRPMQ